MRAPNNVQPHELPGTAPVMGPSARGPAQRLTYYMLVTLLLVVAVLFWAHPAPSAMEVTSFGAKCDGRSNDYLPIEAAFNAAAARCTVHKNQDVWNQNYVDLPPGHTCKVNSPLVIKGSCVGLRSNGAVLDFSSLAPPATLPVAAVTVRSSHPASPYGDNVVTWDGLHLAGPGRDTHTIGLLIETGQAVFERLDINSFGVGTQFGDYAYVDHFDQPSIFSVGTGIYCPSHLIDSGENITISQGAIFNSRVAINNQGCGLTLLGTSIDGMSSSAIINKGTFRCIACYIEYFQSIVDPVFELGGCNAWSYFIFDNGTIKNDHRGKNVLALVRNERVPCAGAGPWAYFNNVFFGGISPSAPCNAGHGPACIIGNNAGQIHVFHSTDGAGGGAIGNVKVP
jgi:hypothetical protein